MDSILRMNDSLFSTPISKPPRYATSLDRTSSFANAGVATTTTITAMACTG